MSDPTAHRGHLEGPTWVSQATIKGGALMLAGVVVMITPDQQKVLRTIIGVLLIGWALSELWISLVRRQLPTEHPDSLAGTSRLRWWLPRTLVGLAVVLGATLLVFEKVRLTVVVGIVVAGKGAIDLWRALVGDRSARQDRVIYSVLLLVVGLVCVVVPDTAILALRAGIGIAAIGLGAILISTGLRRRSDEPEELFDGTSVPRLVVRWLRDRRIEPATRDQLVDTLYFEPPNRPAKVMSFWVMMCLATSIASFAIVQDSTAVVIGAMLVAPLMTPILGVAAASVNGWAARLGRSLALVAMAAAVGIAIAWLIAAWLPSVGELGANTQITSRVEPSLVDFCIALAAGAAGAWASIDPRVSSSLAGVAIAVALVPPLSVVGITLEAGQYEWAMGALLLFLTNFVSIVLMATLVFVLSGFAAIPPDQDQRVQMRRVISVFSAGALLIIVPLSLTSEQVWTESFDEATSSKVVDTWLEGQSDLELVEVDVDGTDVTVDLTGSSTPTKTDALKQQLADALGFEPGLTLQVAPTSIMEVD